jgi:hypothetical protein
LRVVVQAVIRSVGKRELKEGICEGTIAQIVALP